MLNYYTSNVLTELSSNKYDHRMYKRDHTCAVSPDENLNLNIQISNCACSDPPVRSPIFARSLNVSQYNLWHDMACIVYNLPTSQT